MPPLTMSDELVRDNVAQELERLEAEAHRAMHAKHWRFLGPSKVLAMSPFERAKSWQPLSRSAAANATRCSKPSPFCASFVARIAPRLRSGEPTYARCSSPRGPGSCAWGTPRSLRRHNSSCFEPSCSLRLARGGKQTNNLTRVGMEQTTSPGLATNNLTRVGVRHKSWWRRHGASPASGRNRCNPLPVWRVLSVLACPIRVASCQA